MIFRSTIFIFLSFFVMQSFAKYTSHCSFHIEGAQDSLHSKNSIDQSKDAAIKFSDSNKEANNEDDCDCPYHGSGCCLYNNFLVSKTTHQFIYINGQSLFTERPKGFLPKPYLDAPFQPPRT